MNMDIGWLWIDRDMKKPLTQKIEEGLKAFKDKYEHEAEYCLVNMTDAQSEDLENIAKTCNVYVQAHRFILPNSLWIGFDGLGEMKS